MAARAKLEPALFATDDGSADSAVVSALEAADRPRHEYLDALWGALAASRVIVPVAAHALPGARTAVHLAAPDVGSRTPDHTIHTNDAAQDAATLAVDLPDGHVALPVFTSAQAMSRWRADVRPVPVEPRRAAQVACVSTDRLWVLDPGTRDLRLPRPAVVALSGGEAWVPSWRNGPVQAEVRAQLEERHRGGLRPRAGRRAAGIHPHRRLARPQCGGPDPGGLPAHHGQPGLGGPHRYR